jgi:protein-L-isoaspartate O-methyltransferase
MIASDETPSLRYPSYDAYPSESDHTPPSDFCAQPSLWHAADGDSAEFEVLELVAAFVRALQPEAVIETGSAFGFGASMIGKALLANGHGKLYSLELDGPRADIARIRVAKLPVDIINVDSTTWLPPSADVGFAFFDSSMDARPVEFKRYLPFMVTGAIVAFHDTGPQHSLWESVQTLEREGLLKVIQLRTPRGVAFGQVLKT